MIFSLLGLLLTLALVGWLVKQQLQAVKTLPVAPMVAADAASSVGVSVTPGNQLQQIRSQVEQALAQGAAARASDAGQ